LDIVIDTVTFMMILVVHFLKIRSMNALPDGI